MNSDCFGLELFPAKERKNWWKKKKKLENWCLWTEWNICPLISQFISCQKKVIFSNTRLLDCFVMALDQKREKVKNQMVFFICS